MREFPSTRKTVGILFCCSLHESVEKKSGGKRIRKYRKTFSLSDQTDGVCVCTQDALSTTVTDSQCTNLHGREEEQCITMF